jgi:putative DNA primase/helicase
MRIGQKLVGCQTISEDGTKKFLYGQITKGAELCIDNKGKHLLVEGYASAMSLRRILKSVGLKYTIHVCFSAANIIQIASNYEQCIVVADNDSVGLNSAKKTGKPFWSSPIINEDINDFEIRLGTAESARQFIASGLMEDCD